MKITFRDKIILRMRELGVSSRAICFDLRMKEGNFSAYLHGRRRLPYKDLELVMSYLGLTLSGGRLRDSIYYAIKEKGQKKKDVAAACGLVDTSLSSYLTGNRGLGYEQLERLSQYLGLSLQPRKGFVFRSAFLDAKEAARKEREEAKRAKANLGATSPSE